MAWNKERSANRIKERDFAASEVVISKLSRERDFENIGSKEAVEAQGVHFYADFGGFRTAVENAAEDQMAQKKAVRALNVLTKIADILACRGEVSQVLQVQGSRTHGLTFKPYDDEAARSLEAVLTAFDFCSYAPIFNEIFEKEIGMPFFAEIGMDAGKTYIVNCGKRGCRELLSLGGPASIAAKNIGDPDSVTISEKMYGHLPRGLKVLFSKESKGERVVYVARNFRWANLESLRKELGHKFPEGSLRQKTIDFKAEYNLDEIEISRPLEKIDFDKLSSRIVKRQDSVSVYADLDGFTAYMDSLKTESDVREMLRLFTGIRTELEDVLTVDFDPGVKVQQRGDCMLANFHLPSNIGDESARTETAVEAAVGLMSSIEVLTTYFKPSFTLELQIGAGSGKMFFSRIGKNGQKTAAVVGFAEDLSEKLQRDSSPREIRICSKTYGRLPDGTLKNAFSKKGEAYVAKGLTQARLIALEDEDIERGAWERRAQSEAAKPGLLQVGVAAGKKGAVHVNTTPHLTKK